MKYLAQNPSQSRSQFNNSDCQRFTLLMTTELLPAFNLDGLHWDSVPPSLRPRFNALLQDEDFVGASTRHSQIGVAMHSLREDEDEEQVVFSVLSAFFGIAERNIEWQARRCHDGG
jgi:hypothetical protein